MLLEKAKSLQTQNESNSLMSHLLCGWFSSDPLELTINESVIKSP